MRMSARLGLGTMLLANLLESDRELGNCYGVSNRGIAFTGRAFVSLRLLRPTFLSVSIALYDKHLFHSHDLDGSQPNSPK